MTNLSNVWYNALDFFNAFLLFCWYVYYNMQYATATVSQQCYFHLSRTLTLRDVFRSLEYLITG